MTGGKQVKKEHIKIFISLILVLGILALAISCGTKTATTTQTTTATATQTATTTQTNTATATQTSTQTTTTTATTTTTTTPKPTIKTGGTLRVIYPYMGTSLGWPAASLGGYGMYQQFCFETLLRQNMDGSITPRLATSYTIADDLKSMTFTLRQNVKFHDGSTFNAESVKFSLEALKAEKKGDSIYIDSVNIIDANTVKINFTKWLNWLPNDVSGWQMLSKTAYDKNGLDWMKKNMVGTGPFKQTAWQQDVQMTFEKNKDYWQAGKPYLDKIIVDCVADSVTAQATILAGDADILNTEADKKVVDLRAKGLQAITREVGVCCMFPDSKNPDSPLANKKVREAIEYAIDKDTLSSSLSGGFLTTNYQMIAKSMNAYNPALPNRKYDPVKAKALLTEAGYPNGFTFTIYPCPVPLFNDQAVAIQAELKKIGINAVAEMITDAKFGALVTQPAPANSMVLAAVSSCVPNWVQALSGFFNPEYTLYPTMLRTEEYRTVFYEAANAKAYDVAKTQAVLKQIYDDIMVVPTFSSSEAWVFQSYVKGAWEPWPAGLQMWSPENCWLDK
jgi:peptide/nickel transport system substrate-binding protein